MNSHEVFIHIHQGCFAGTGAIVRLPQCQWSKPDGYGKISQCITTTKHSKAKTVCIFLGIYCMHIERWSQHWNSSLATKQRCLNSHSSLSVCICIMNPGPITLACNFAPCIHLLKTSGTSSTIPNTCGTQCFTPRGTALPMCSWYC